MSGKTTRSSRGNKAVPAWLARSGIHTVVVAFPDVYGRLMGKRLTREHFVEHVLGGGTHACNYLLTVDIEMNPLPGFALASWDQGYGDFHLTVDASTLRPAPWVPGTAIVLGDLAHEHGDPVGEAPRTILRTQVAALAQRGLGASMASELEFYLFDEDYRTARAQDYRGLRASSDYLIDYHLLGTARDEDVLARVRNEIAGAGIAVEGTKGEWGKGQYELNLLYAEALEMADRHVLAKHAAREIAQQQERAITFMAKWQTDEAGSSCHVHTSLWDRQHRQNRFAGRGGPTPLFRHFLGGLLTYGRELSYFFAPTVNAYKRYQAASWAPTALVWAHDNRTTGYRVVGNGPALRIENRMPGADVNPYLAYAATLAAGLRGIDEKIDCGDPYEGNAYEDPRLPRLPGSLAEAADLLDGSAIARSAFGDHVVDFYVHTARLESEAHRQAVTDWERRRYFERV